MKNLDDAAFQKALQTSHKVFDGVRFDVHALELPAKSGTMMRKEFVAHPGAVVILPILNDRVIMIKNERFAVGKTLWELPAGTLEPNEPHETTAYRELIEETGYEAKKMTPLLSYYMTPGICNEIMYSYLAQDLNEVGQHLDDSENITVEVLKWDQIENMIQEGTICDCKTLLTLLYYCSKIAS